MLFRFGKIKEWIFSTNHTFMLSFSDRRSWQIIHTHTISKCVEYFLRRLMMMWNWNWKWGNNNCNIFFLSRVFFDMIFLMLSCSRRLRAIWCSSHFRKPSGQLINFSVGLLVTPVVQRYSLFVYFSFIDFIIADQRHIFLWATANLEFRAEFFAFLQCIGQMFP